MPPQADTSHRCSVLIVDADPDFRELLRVALSADGYTVSCAGDGRAALNQLRSTADTCIVLFDLRLPGMDGRQFRAAQRRDRALAWIPAIVVSGEPDAAAIARELEVSHFVPKPADLDEVRRAVAGAGCCHAQPRRARF
jgi:two-component system response regulator (stage 0 sporulation protein F)